MVTGKKIFNNYILCTLFIFNRYGDNVGCALIEILEHGITGETWIVENDKLPRLVEY